MKMRKKRKRLTKYRIHFEPEDIDADSPELAVVKLRAMQLQCGVALPAVRKIFPVDTDGFAVKE